MYQGYDPERDNIKKSTKGVPTRNKFKMKLFQSVLLDEQTPRQKVTINSLRLNRNKEMTRMRMEKSSLRHLGPFLMQKFFVHLLLLIIIQM